MPTWGEQAGRRRILGLILAAVTAATACSSNSLEAPPPTIEAVGPAASPPAAQNPAGAVLGLTGRPSAAWFDGHTRRLAVLCSAAEPAAAATLAVFGAEQPLTTPPQVIALPGPALALTGDGNGTVYLAARGGYFAVDLAAGHAARVNVTDTDFTAIALRSDGRLVLGSADGAVYTLAAASPSGTARVENRNKIFARVDALATQGNTTAVLDRGQTSVTTIGADGRTQQALRAGEGATTMAADPAGRILVVDTRGGQLLVYGVDPLILRQAYPVPQSPYGLTGSRELAWVAQTGSNVVIGYDLSTGIPVEKVRYPTVQQPNSLAYDEPSGTLYVVSGSGAGVQVIEHAAGAR